MLTKTCSRCGKILEATEENFHVKIGGKYGLHSECKECRRERRRSDYKKSKKRYETYNIIGNCRYRLEFDQVRLVKNGVEVALSFEQFKHIFEKIKGISD